MKSERTLLESIFQTALEGCDANVKARKDALWSAAVTLQADVLLNSHPYERERLLRGLVAELRKSIDRLSKLLEQPAGKLIVSLDDAT